MKRAAVEQIRTARQTSEEACWQCGRPATETCSGIGIGIGSATETCSGTLTGIRIGFTFGVGVGVLLLVLELVLVLVLAVWQVATETCSGTLADIGIGFTFGVGVGIGIGSEGGLLLRPVSNMEFCNKHGFLHILLM